METTLMVTGNEQALAVTADTARQFIGQAKAESTKRAYSSDWSDYRTWCESHGFAALPSAPGTIVLYLSERAATCRVSTLTRRVAAISQAHQFAGHQSPTGDIQVRAVMAGIRRALGTAPTMKAPAVTGDIRSMVATLPAGLLGVRDRALLLVGFAAALRRSELVALDFEDCEFTRDGLVINQRRSKVDQEGQGRKIGVAYGSDPATCPVRSLRAWIESAGIKGIKGGPLFRSVNRHGQIQTTRLCDKAVALVVKRTATAAGLEAAKYAGHSLRAGLATSAAMAGVSERAIMAQTGHKSTAMVRRYIRDGSLFRENASAKVGL
jgi:integrase